MSSTQFGVDDVRRHSPRADLVSGLGGVPQPVREAVERWDEYGRPAQAPTAWQRDRWVAAMPTETRWLNTLPDRLDRSIVRQSVLDRPPTTRGMFEAMVIVYAWGWSTTNVGVPRARKALGAGVEGLGAALLAAREEMDNGGPLDGYSGLAGRHRVNGLGPSFGSKFLYFVSSEERRALILDDLVAKWLARETAIEFAPNRWSVETYADYLAVMQAWSSDLGIADHQLEEILFTEEATRRGLPAWSATPQR
jgi:hypothetical protein